MEIHKFEKIWIIASILLIIVYIGTVTYGALGAGVQMVGKEGGQVSEPTQPTENENFREPGMYKVAPNHYEVYVLAQQFVFRPGSANPIQVPAGSKVTFYLTSKDVLHGFELVGTNVNTMAIPGQVNKFSVRFKEPKSYGLICHEFCGTGHHLMEGAVQVIPSDEYEADQK